MFIVFFHKWATYSLTEGSKMTLLLIVTTIREWDFVLMLLKMSQRLLISLLDTATCQVKKCKIISEQSLVTGWLAGWLAGWLCGLSTSFPIFLTQGKQNPGTRLRLLVTSGSRCYPESEYSRVGRCMRSKFLKLFWCKKVDL